jgi:tetratricopeptide (TPR) repeat protein
MTRHGFTLAALVPALLVSASATSADTIRRTDGKEIADVRVQTETLKEVLYKRGNRDESVPSEEVLSITFDKMPEGVELGLSALSLDDFGQAEADFDLFVEQHLAGEEVAKRYEWAPAFAAFKVVDVRLSMGNLPGAVQAADRLIRNFPDSRYVPMAFMAKADAYAWQGKGADAKKALEDFRGLIDTQGLSTRWGLECDLGLILNDSSLRGQAKRDRLAVVESQAGNTYPTVKSRAEVAAGQSFIEEIIEERDVQKKLAAVGEARVIFEGILKEFKADEATLSGAYVGLGDCLWTEATSVSPKDVVKLREARLQYLRVPMLYRTQSSYLPKAYFMSGLCSWEIADIARDEEEKQRALLLFSRLIREFPSSPFVEQAKRYF